MRHARPDYQRIQDPATDDPSLLAPGATPIGADEPVMLFRAQDRYFIAVLEAYDRMLVAHYDDDEGIRQAILVQITRAREWQLAHGCKTPDL